MLKIVCVFQVINDALSTVCLQVPQNDAFENTYVPTLKWIGQ